MRSSKANSLPRFNYLLALSFPQPELSKFQSVSRFPRCADSGCLVGDNDGPAGVPSGPHPRGVPERVPRCRRVGRRRRSLRRPQPSKRSNSPGSLPLTTRPKPPFRPALLSTPDWSPHHPPSRQVHLLDAALLFFVTGALVALAEAFRAADALEVQVARMPLWFMWERGPVARMLLWFRWERGPTAWKCRLLDGRAFKGKNKVAKVRWLCGGSAGG